MADAETLTLTLSTGGLLSGTPSAAGSFTFTLVCGSAVDLARSSFPIISRA